MTQLDARLFRTLHEALSGGSPLLLLMAALTVLGSGWSMLALVPLLARTRTRAFASALIGTLAGASLVVFVVKSLVRRARPCSCLDGVRALVFDAPEDFSFPSGHSAGSFAFAAFASVLLLSLARTPRRWLVAAALFALAASIALSRIALGVHFPGDVCAGALVGLASGAIGARLYARRRATAREDSRALR